MSARRRDLAVISRDVLARFKALCRADRGGTMIEYCLIAALIGGVLIVALTLVRGNLQDLPFPSLIAAFTEALT